MLIYEFVYICVEGVDYMCVWYAYLYMLQLVHRR